MFPYSWNEPFIVSYGSTINFCIGNFPPQNCFFLQSGFQKDEIDNSDCNEALKSLQYIQPYQILVSILLEWTFHCALWIQWVITNNLCQKENIFWGMMKRISYVLIFTLCIIVHVESTCYLQYVWNEIHVFTVMHVWFFIRLLIMFVFNGKCQGRLMAFF